MCLFASVLTTLEAIVLLDICAGVRYLAGQRVWSRQMKVISYICVTVGIISIISAMTLALHAIWVGADTTLWKGLITCGVLFAGSLLGALITRLGPLDRGRRMDNSH